MVVKVLDLEDVFSFFFNDINIDTYYRKVIAITPLALSTPKTFLMVLVFLASLALISGRLLVFATNYVINKNVNRLSLFGVLLFFLCRLISLKTF